jgi:pyruvate/2-oxoglutarate dehydrogenase complex dihydrolipoamide dehydrogenase (E3) component
MPAVVFTEPQVATVGYSEADAHHGAGPGRSVAPLSDHGSFRAAQAEF